VRRRTVKAQIRISSGPGTSEGVMSKTVRRSCRWLVALSVFAMVTAALGQGHNPQIGREVAIPIHLQDGEEFNTPLNELIRGQQGTA